MVRPRVLGALLVGVSLLGVFLPAQTVAVGTFLESFTVGAADVDGTTSTTMLEAGAIYRITAAGYFQYRSGRFSDAECTSPPLDPLGLGSYSWTRYGHFFYALNHPLDAGATIPWDPDPTDDATDLYVDNRNVEWVPTQLSNATPFGCAANHTYETYLVPVEDRKINVRVFDTWYDNDNLNIPPYPAGPVVSIYEVAAPPFPDVVYLETVLVHTRDPNGSVSTVLSPGNYLLLAHGEYKYTTSLGPDSFADAECSNGNPLGVGDGALWLRERFVAGKLELLVNNGDTYWMPLAPAPAEVMFTPPGFCDPLTHYYYQVFSGTPSTFKIQDDNYTDNIGTLSVEIFKLL